MQTRKIIFVSRQTVKNFARLISGNARARTVECSCCPCCLNNNHINKKASSSIHQTTSSKFVSSKKYFGSIKMDLELSDVVKKIEEDAPTFLAESWDNVGLLVEPSPPHKVTRIMLTNDLTEEVLEEAVTKQANMIISYHPPIFVPMKRLTQKSVKERIVVKCVENRIAVYSPHTVYDALDDGVNNWLAQAFSAKGIVQKRPLSRKFSPFHLGQGSYHLDVTVPATLLSVIIDDFAFIAEFPMVTKSIDGASARVSYSLSEEDLSKALGLLKTKHTDIVEKSEVIQLDKPPYPGAGVGLTFSVEQDVTLKEAVSMVKEHIGLQHLRLCIGSGCTIESRIKSVAVCAGSGSSVLRGSKADLYLTGEMSHHDLLDATSKGVNVILCEHSNSERGFLNELSNRLQRKFHGAKMDIVISACDKDPVAIV